MPYAMYLRKSRADIEAEARSAGETLAVHEKTLTELAEKSGFAVVKIYREIVSGETIDSRPQVQRLLAEVERGAYEGVLVMDADRLARGDSVDQGLVARAFRLSGTKIVTPRKIYDPCSEFDEEYFEFELFMARREYKLINRRIQRGRLASAREGRYIGSTAPYGYDRVKISGGKGYTLSPNREADTVKYIFEQYLAGSGASLIAASLDDMGVPTRKGGCWSKATVADILKNPVYMGMIRWSRRKSVKKSVNGRIVTARTVCGDCLLVPGLHKPIIEEDVFRAVQKRLESSAKKPLRSGDVLKNPFAGLFFCGICGARMTRLGKNSHTRYDALKCPNKKCGCVSSPMSTVEQAVCTALAQWLAGYEVAVGEGTESHSARYDKLAAAIEELSAEDVKLQSQKEKIYDFFEQGVYTAQVFSERMTALEARRRETETKISRLRDGLREYRRDSAARREIAPHTASLFSAYAACSSAEEKNGFLKALLAKAEYRKLERNRRGGENSAEIVIDIYPKIENRGKR